MPLDSTNWKQETETKPDVFSLEGLIAWLERQPARASYEWRCGGNCLFARWGMAITNLSGLDAYIAATNGLSDALGLPRDLEPTNIACNHPSTFGAALSRARALLKDCWQSVTNADEALAATEPK